MSELEQIACDYNITIVDSLPGDSGDSRPNDNNQSHHSLVSSNTSSKVSQPQTLAAGDLNDIVKALEAEFSYRYTDSDPDYLKTVEEAVFWAKPPCVENFFVRRPRDDSRRGWNRQGAQNYRGGRGGSGDYRQRDNSWGRYDNRNAGDNQNRGSHYHGRGGQQYNNGYREQGRHGW